MSLPNFTVVCAVDALHLEELRVSYPTWLQCPILATSPLLVLKHPEVKDREVFETVLKHRAQVQIVEVPIAGFASQRETMLSAFVLTAPQHVQTPYYLKCDTDSIFTGGNWIDAAWFRDLPALVSIPWGYSKPADSLDRLDRWAATIPELQFRPPLARVQLPDRVKHPRIISYVMFGDTHWTRMVAKWAGERLPVPSQDGFLSYCAERGGYRYVRTRMPQWVHVGRGGERLRQKANEILGGANATT